MYVHPRIVVTAHRVRWTSREICFFLFFKLKIIPKTPDNEDTSRALHDGKATISWIFFLMLIRNGQKPTLIVERIKNHGCTRLPFKRNGLVLDNRLRTTASWNHHPVSHTKWCQNHMIFFEFTFKCHCLKHSDSLLVNNWYVALAVGIQGVGCFHVVIPTFRFRTKITCREHPLDLPTHTEWPFIFHTNW